LRFFLSLFFALCLFLASVAQQAKQYAFTHFTSASGLPSNLVNNIAQDEEGFMWFGTVNGLTRYDGYRFLNVLSPHNNPSFLFGNIGNLYYDRQFNMWIITADKKVGIFNTRDFTYREVRAEVMRKEDFSPLNFLETPDGTVLMQEHAGYTYRYDRHKNLLVVDSTTIPHPKGWHRTRTVWDPSIRKYWMAADSGLALYNPTTKALNYRGHNVEQDKAIDAFQNETNVLDLTVDSSGNLLFHAWPPRWWFGYLFCYNNKTGTVTKTNLIEKLRMGYHELGSFLVQRNGRRWVFGHPVLTEWQPQENTFTPVVNEYRNEQSIKFDYVRALYEDGERNVWVATDNGLFFFNPDAQLFDNYSFLSPDGKETREYPATVLMQAWDSTIFVGRWGHPPVMYDKAFNPVPVPRRLLAAFGKNWSIWDMHQHSKTGKIWMTLQSGEICIYDPGTGHAVRVIPPVFHQRTIRQVTEDGEGNLWFGTQSGAIIKWSYAASHGDPEVGYHEIARPGLVYKLITDNKGFIWAGLEWGETLVRIDPSTDKIVQRFSNKGPAGQSLLSTAVTDILQYNDSIIIAVSNGLNLINLNTNQVRHITTANGLPSNTGLCIERDKEGILWLGMSNGLCRINLQKNFFTLYDRRNGIVYDNFNLAGAHRLPSGKIAFTTDHNFLVLDPQRFTYANSVPPDPDFTSFKLSNVSLSLDSLLTLGKVVLPYNNNSIALEFSVLSFLKQKQPNYSYILEGFDKDWIQTEGTNQALYSYVPPGRYTFKVKAINQDGVYSHGLAELDVIVQPPFWRTWWFYAAAALAFTAILYQIDRERQNRRRALQAVRTQIAGDLHEEINVTLNDINLLSEIAKMKADKDLDRSKEYIDQISTKSRSMIESMDDILWSIHPENDTMEKMLFRIYEFTDGVKKTAGLDVELTVDKEVERLTLDMKMRHEFLLFYKDALVYVIQHSVCSTVYISLEYIKSKLALKLLAQCNQHETPSGQQLMQLEYQMQRRADALNGLLDIISDRRSISIIMQTRV
jgi:ligand-binding sensor domain-containing protein/signal transduction histidine kinase